MEQPKTYTATIEVTFEISEGENPRAIAKDMANIYNYMRGANLRACGVMKKLTEETRLV